MHQKVDVLIFLLDVKKGDFEFFFFIFYLLPLLPRLFPFDHNNIWPNNKKS